MTTYTYLQCCGSETFHYGSGSNFQKVPDPVSDPAFFLKKYGFKGPKMAFQNIIFKEYLNLVYENGQNYNITPFFDDFCLCLHPFSDIDPDLEPSN
jgi:hypothetical protein